DLGYVWLISGRRPPARVVTDPGGSPAEESPPDRRASKASAGRRFPKGAKGEALAKQFEGKVQEATAVVEKLSDADWKKATSAEKWTVGVVAHHVAMSHEGITRIIKTVSTGQSVPNFTMDMLNAIIAQPAKVHARFNNDEIVALHQK